MHVNELAGVILRFNCNSQSDLQRFDPKSDLLTITPLCAVQHL